MSHQFGPRKVEQGSWQQWSQQALMLQSRLKMANIAGSLLCLGYYIWLVQVDNVVLTVLSMLVAAPLMLSMFIFLAAHADGKKLMPPEQQRGKVLLRVLGLGILNWGLLIFIFGSLYLVGFLISEIFDLSLGAAQGAQSSSGNSAESSGVINQLYLFIAALVYTVIPLAAWYSQSLIPYISIWFVPLLVIVTPLNVMQAYKMSWQAEKLNWREVNSLSMFALGLLSLILVSGGILALIILPYLGSLMYVSFRDVFLGQNKNSIVKSACSSNTLISPRTKPSH